MVASSSAFEGLSSVVQLVCQFLLWSVSRVHVIFEHARLVFVSFKRDSSARLCFGRFDSCRKDLFHFMHANALFVSLFWNDSFFYARIVGFSWTLTFVEFGR